MAKLINIKQEFAQAKESVCLFLIIKNEAITAFSKFPNADRDIIVKTLCDYHGMSLDDFRFLCDVEGQTMMDYLKSGKKQK